MAPKIGGSGDAVASSSDSSDSASSSSSSAKQSHMERKQEMCESDAAPNDAEWMLPRGPRARIHLRVSVGDDIIMVCQPSKEVRGGVVTGSSMAEANGTGHAWCKSCVKILRSSLGADKNNSGKMHRFKSSVSSFRPFLCSSVLPSVRGFC